MVTPPLEISATFSANALDFLRAIKLVSNRNLDVRPLISARTRLENALQVFENLLRDKGSQTKVLFLNQ
jgi:threonine dehydrogenase-like Zn-dependent dehydrogenase